MEAYTTQIKVYDDDNELIATLDHDADNIFKVTLPETYVSPTDLRFIADVLDDTTLTDYIKKG